MTVRRRPARAPNAAHTTTLGGAAHDRSPAGGDVPSSGPHPPSAATGPGSSPTSGPRVGPHPPSAATGPGSSRTSGPRVGPHPPSAATGLVGQAAPRPDARPVGDDRPRRGPRLRRWLRGRADDERGDFAIFIAVIASALLVFGGIAYDAPRLNAARQDALHKAGEAARVAAATVAGGGTVEQARQAVEDRTTPLVYGADVEILPISCVGSRVEVTVVSGYAFRSVLAAARGWQTIVATAAAEATLVLPSGEPSPLNYLGECPL